MSCENFAFGWRSQLPPAQKLVLLWLCDNTYLLEPYNASVARLAEFVGVTEEEVRAILKSLDQDGYIDIIDDDHARPMISVRVPAPQPPNPPEPRQKDPLDRGYVYFLYAPELARIKIGTTRSPRNRIHELAKQAPVRCELMKVVPGGKRLELELHRRFAAIRVVGEWFSATESLVAYIDSQSMADEFA